MTLYSTSYSSPVGWLHIFSNDTHLVKLDFVENEADATEEQPQVLKDTVQQLDEYFAGGRKNFTVPFEFQGTDFQKRVWTELTLIPFGETISYLQQATRAGTPKAVRAVGSTNGKNPVAIIVPCHRVIGTNGKLVGYSSGVWRKQWLLDHERKHFSAI